MENQVVPVFCDRKVVMKITLVPSEGITKEEFVEQGVKVLAEKVLENLGHLHR